jgi:hypothetical protein
LEDARRVTYHSLHDENPLPSVESLKRRHLTEAISEDTGKGRGNTSDQVEEGIALLDLVYERRVSS